jgi:hypothetical protein
MRTPPNCARVQYIHGSMDSRVIANWTEAHKTATFLIAGYVFAFLSFLPLGLADPSLWKEDLASSIGNIALGIVVLTFLAALYVIPFVAGVICWSLWKRIAKLSLTSRQENLCLGGIWLLVTWIFKDVIFYLPFESGNAVQQHFTIRVLAPLFDGIVLSPMITLLGALAGTAAYKISARWNGPPIIQTLLTIVIVGAEWIAIAVVQAVTGVGGVLLTLLALALAVLGISIKRYQDRQEQAWE